MSVLNLDAAAATKPLGTDYSDDGGEDFKRRPSWADYSDDDGEDFKKKKKKKKGNDYAEKQRPGIVIYDEEPGADYSSGAETAPPQVCKQEPGIMISANEEESEGNVDK